eukprot:8696558-Alexandrium_andersonii.AAC.1
MCIRDSTYEAQSPGKKFDDVEPAALGHDDSASEDLEAPAQASPRRHRGQSAGSSRQIAASGNSLQGLY